MKQPAPQTFFNRSKLPGRVWFRPAGTSDAVPLYEMCFAGKFDQNGDNQPERIHVSSELGQRSLHHFLFNFRQSLQEQEQGRRLHLVVDTETGPIGTGKLIRLPGKTEIADLMIAPTWRNNGLGTAMVLHLVDQAKKWGYGLVEIGVMHSNVQALALYRRLGFGEERELAHPGKEPAVLLKLRLHKPEPI